MQQLAHEITRGTKNSQIDAFRPEAPQWLADVGADFDIEIEPREQDGVIKSILVDGKQRPNVADLLDEISPDLKRTHGSLSSLVHGEAWRMVFPTALQGTDGVIQEIPDDLFASDVAAVMQVSCHALDASAAFIGIDLDRQPWRQSLTEACASVGMQTRQQHG